MVGKEWSRTERRQRDNVRKPKKGPRGAITAKKGPAVRSPTARKKRMNVVRNKRDLGKGEKKGQTDRAKVTPLYCVKDGVAQDLGGQCASK